jgi:ribosomal protein S18 acetylase RimI-like enzyme
MLLRLPGLEAYAHWECLLGRLAVDMQHQGKHLGRSLLLDAMRVLQAEDLIGIRALLVHAIDSRAQQWYAQFGFERSPTTHCI